MSRLTALLFLGIVSLASGSGCAFPSSTANRSSSENISVSEATKNGVCLATVTVQESVNGRKQTRHQANIPCANVKAVQSTLAAQAKQGL